jgi:hypothetical protein
VSDVTPVPPPPTQTPAPNIQFTAEPTTITAGQVVLFKWAVQNAKAVYFYYDGQNWSDHAAPLVSQATEYPPYTINYNLHVVKNNGEVVVRTITIEVKKADNAPVIEYLSATPSQVMVGECVRIDWSVTGQVDRVILLINNTPVWDYGPVTGNHKDCPDAEGQRIYTLQASGPGGTATQQVSVNVQIQPAPPTEQPVVPTEEPIVPTEEPIEPTPEPPVPVVQPPVIQNFSVEPSNIEPGQCVMASWTTGGGTTRVQLLRDGAVILDNAQLNNSVQDCPTLEASNALTYTLIAYNNAGLEDARNVKVKIAPAPAPLSLANNNRQGQTMQRQENLFRMLLTRLILLQMIV